MLAASPASSAIASKTLLYAFIACPSVTCAAAPPRVPDRPLRSVASSSESSEARTLHPIAAPSTAPDTHLRPLEPVSLRRPFLPLASACNRSAGGRTASAGSGSRYPRVLLLESL